MTPLDLKKEMKPEVFEAILDSLRSGEKPMAVFRTEHFRSDGSKYPVEIKLQYFDEAENKVFLAIVSDITESVEAEKAIAEMNADLEWRVKERTILLEQANAELESFSYSISHDLRTPLRAIDNFSSLLEDKLGDAVDEDCRHYLSRIHGGILKMSRLIDDLLKLSRIGRQAVDLRDIDLAETAREVVKELQAEEPDRKVAISIPARLPGRGDKALAKILMENLLGNAWKFSSQKEEAHIEIGEINPGQPRDGWFIRDDGAGFDERQSSMLFIPFHRLHTEREFSGTGIGLSIAHRIVVRHGGRIWAESKPGEGACFYFTLGESSTGG
jgi:light-regulated signal transduction histidine kinase (bacteriophytochrome)